MARRVGIEPTLADLESAVLPLNERRMVEVTGFEPMTFCLQSRRSTN